MCHKYWSFDFFIFFPKFLSVILKTDPPIFVTKPADFRYHEVMLTQTQKTFFTIDKHTKLNSINRMKMYRGVKSLPPPWGGDIAPERFGKFLRVTFFSTFPKKTQSLLRPQFFPRLRRAKNITLSRNVYQMEPPTTATSTPSNFFLPAGQCGGLKHNTLSKKGYQLEPSTAATIRAPKIFPPATDEKHNTLSRNVYQLELPTATTILTSKFFSITRFQKKYINWEKNTTPREKSRPPVAKWNLHPSKCICMYTNNKNEILD